MSSSGLSEKRAGPSAFDEPLGGFGVTVGFVNASAVLSVRGSMDHLSSCELGAIWDAVVERHLSVVLDLTQLTFISSLGLQVVATRALQLKASGGTLIIRSPSSAVIRMLELRGVAEVAHLERTDPSPSHLGAEQTSERDGAIVDVEPHHMSRYLGMTTGIPADNDVVDGALRLVVALARATVAGADGVSVSLRRYGQLGTVAASDQTISDMDASQYATGEGPCVDASVKGRWFHAESLETETRWPAFTPRAQALGISAILSTPLLAADLPVGALNIYSRTAMAFVCEAQVLASVFATEASSILTAAGVAVTNEQLSLRLGEALRLRRLIAQAEGVIMEREGVGADRAYGMLCDLSRRSSLPFHQHAADVTASTQRLRTASDPEPTEHHDG